MADKLHNLCLRCQNISFDLHEAGDCEALQCQYNVFGRLRLHLYNNNIPAHSVASSHHITLNGLKKSAEDNCHLCTLLWSQATSPESEDLFSSALDSARTRIVVLRHEIQLIINGGDRIHTLKMEDLPSGQTYTPEGNNAVCRYERPHEDVKYVVQCIFRKSIAMDDADGQAIGIEVYTTGDYSRFLRDGYRGLSFTQSELFDVIREDQDNLLARKRGSRDGPIGWIPKKYHMILPKPPHASCACGKGVWEPSLLKRDISAYVDANPISDSMITQMSEWLSHCDQHHKRHDCVSFEPELPLRVVDVGSFDGSRMPFLSVGTGRKGRYAALSYRWGTGKHLKLTSESLDRMTKEISLHELPKTLSDAIVVARLLRIQYLWIDALCIIQDNTKDWLTQSGKMYLVYSNAYFTISANRARTAHEGFLKLRDIATVRSCVLPTSLRKGFSTSNSVALPGSWDSMESYLQGPFFRGWIFQERLFSRRIIHFDHFMTAWECNGGHAREVAPQIRIIGRRAASDGKTNIHVDKPPGTLFAKNEHEKTYWTLHDWYMDLNLFTCTQFTCETDKLAALSGLAMRYSEWLGYDKNYYAGIWGIDFPKGLAWRNASFDDSETVLSETIRYESRKRTPTFAREDLNAGRRRPHESGYIAPSFSWASVSCPVYCAYGTALGREIADSDAFLGSPTLQEAHVTYQQHEFGPVSNCWLRVRGKTILYSKLIRLPKFCERKADAKHIILDNGHYNPDTAILPVSLTILLLYVTPGVPTPAASQWDGIMLIPIDTSKNEFQRVGYYKVAEDCDHLSLDAIDSGIHADGRDPDRAEVYNKDYFAGWKDQELKLI